MAKELFAAVILAVVVAASAWPLYSLASPRVAHRDDIVVRVYRDLSMSLTPITNASLTAIVFYPSPVNGSTVFQVVYSGSYQGTFYINPKALINWSLGWLKKYGPKAYLWLEPSIIFGVTYPVNNGSGPYLVAQLFAEPFNLSYPLEGKGASFNLVISGPALLPLRQPPGQARGGILRPAQTTTLSTSPTTTTTIINDTAYYLEPTQVYYYPSSSGVAPVAIATVVASYNESPSFRGPLLEASAGGVSSSEYQITAGLEISDVNAQAILKAINYLIHGELKGAWSALGQVMNPGASLTLSLYSGSSSGKVQSANTTVAYVAPYGAAGNVGQLYVMAQVAFVNWTAVPANGLGQRVWAYFGPMVTELVVDERGTAAVPAIYYYETNDTCTDIQLWAEGQTNLQEYEAWISYACPYPYVPAPINWTYINYSMNYISSVANIYTSYYFYYNFYYTDAGVSFAFPLNVGFLLESIAPYAGAAEGILEQVAQVVQAVNVAVHLSSTSQPLLTESLIVINGADGYVINVTGTLNTNYFVYNYSGITYRLPVAFMYGAFLQGG